MLLNTRKQLPRTLYAAATGYTKGNEYGGLVLVAIRLHLADVVHVLPQESSSKHGVRAAFSTQAPKR